MNKTVLTTLTSLVIVTTAASAQAITYVDAVQGASGNTFATGGSLADTSWENGTNGNTTSDTTWTLRSPFANGGTVYQARAGAGNAIPELTTQITGLADGVYDIWAYGWDNSGQSWTLDAGLTSGSLTSYVLDSEGTDAGTQTFASAPLTSEDGGDRVMYGVYLGQSTVVGGSAINVYIDSSATSSGGGEDRSWYDGVGYSAVPEPGSFALIGGLAALAWVACRRRNS